MSDIINLLSQGKEEMARIKVESMISTDFMIESLSVIELMCELIHERINYISSQKECPADLLEAISTLVYAADKVDIEELRDIKSQFSKKYGSKFIKNCNENVDETVNSRLIAKLKVSPPSSALVGRYLNEISKEANINWKPSVSIESENVPVPSPSGYSIPMAPGSDLRGAYQRQQEPEFLPCAIINNQIIPEATNVVPVIQDTNNEFDDLHARFAALQNNDNTKA